SVGADARISGASERATLPDELVRTVRDLDGVRGAAPVRIEYSVNMPEAVAGGGGASGDGAGTGSGSGSG
ncbi:hypothetical protein, partial [Streptomyces anulatus]